MHGFDARIIASGRERPIPVICIVTRKLPFEWGSDALRIWNVSDPIGFANRGVVQRDGVDLDLDDLRMLQPFKYTIKDAGFRPATPVGIGGMPATKALR
jgi:hypothetical protein